MTFAMVWVLLTLWTGCVLLQCKWWLTGCAGDVRVRALPAAEADKDGFLKFYWFLAALVSGYVGHMRKDGSRWYRCHIMPSCQSAYKNQMGLSHLICGDFAAGAAMITLGAIIGKYHLQQLFFLVWWEAIFYVLNEAICVSCCHVTDSGGSILVHTFRAYFGVASKFDLVFQLTTFISAPTMNRRLQI